jgi:WD40 repeat protein
MESSISNKINLTIVDKKNSLVLKSLDREKLFLSSTYFQSLLSAGFKEKNSSEITIEVPYAKIAHDLIMRLTPPGAKPGSGCPTGVGLTKQDDLSKKSSHTYAKQQMKTCICADYLGIIDYDFDYNVVIPVEEFDSILCMCELLCQNKKLYEMMRRNIPKEYDLNKIPESIARGIINLEPTKKTIYIASFNTISEETPAIIKIWEWDRCTSRLLRTLNYPLHTLKYPLRPKKIKFLSNGNINIFDTDFPYYYCLPLSIEVVDWEIPKSLHDFSNLLSPSIFPDGETIIHYPPVSEESCQKYHDGTAPYIVNSQCGKIIGPLPALFDEGIFYPQIRISEDSKKIIFFTRQKFMIYDIKTETHYYKFWDWNNWNPNHYTNSDSEYDIEHIESNTAPVYFYPKHVFFSPDNKKFITANDEMFPVSDGYVHIWDIDTGKLLLTLNIQFDKKIGPKIKFTPDGKKIISLYQNDIKLFNSEREIDFLDSELDRLYIRTCKEMYVCVDRFGSICNMFISPNSEKLILTHEHGTITIWNIDTCNLSSVLHGHTKTINNIEFLSNNKFVSVCEKCINVWNGKTGKLLCTLQNDDEYKIESVTIGKYDPIIEKLKKILSEKK